jgi:hypothetical protein
MTYDEVMGKIVDYVERNNRNRGYEGSMDIVTSGKYIAMIITRSEDGGASVYGGILDDAFKNRLTENYSSIVAKYGENEIEWEELFYQSLGADHFSFYTCHG